MDKLQSRLNDINILSKTNKINSLELKTKVLITENSELTKQILLLKERNIELLKQQEIISKLEEKNRALVELLKLKENEIIEIKKQLSSNKLKKEIELLQYTKQEQEKKIENLLLLKNKNIELEETLACKNKIIQELKLDFKEKLARIEIDSELNKENIKEKFQKQLEKESEDLESIIKSKVKETEKLVNLQNKKLLFESNCILYKNSELEEIIKTQKNDNYEIKIKEKINKSALEMVLVKNIEMEKVLLFVLSRCKEIVERNNEACKRVLVNEGKEKKRYDYDVSLLNYEIETLKNNLHVIPEFIRVITDVIVELYNEGKIAVSENSENKGSNLNNNIKEQVTENTFFLNTKNIFNLNFRDMTVKDKLNFLALVFDRIVSLLKDSKLFKITTPEEQTIQFKLKVFNSDYISLHNEITKEHKSHYKKIKLRYKNKLMRNKNAFVSSRVSRVSRASKRLSRLMKNNMSRELSETTRNYMIDEVFNNIKKKREDLTGIFKDIALKNKSYLWSNKTGNGLNTNLDNKFNNKIEGTNTNKNSIKGDISDINNNIKGMNKKSLDGNGFIKDFGKSLMNDIVTQKITSHFKNNNSKTNYKTNANNIVSEEFDFGLEINKELEDFISIITESNDKVKIDNNGSSSNKSLIKIVNSQNKTSHSYNDNINNIRITNISENSKNNLDNINTINNINCEQDIYRYKINKNDIGRNINKHPHTNIVKVKFSDKTTTNNSKTNINNSNNSNNTLIFNSNASNRVSLQNQPIMKRINNDRALINRIDENLRVNMSVTKPKPRIKLKPIAKSSSYLF